MAGSSPAVTTKLQLFLGRLGSILFRSSLSRIEMVSITSSNDRLESAGLNVLEELLSKMLGRW